jgi:molecular chaperone DnaK (HSP70)
LNVAREKPPAVGLDFGTSTTLVASHRSVVPIGASQAWMPSLSGYTEDGLLVVGEEAQHLPVGRVIRSIKRAITQPRAFVPVDLPTGVRSVRTDDLVAALLREAVRRASAAGQDLSAKGRLRLGCPAMWDGAQRRRLVAAARDAGLPVTLACLVDEPVAAGIAWLAAYAGDLAGPRRVLVFDMGGGTLDVAVLDVDGRDISVLAALGTAEAGDALDEAIAGDLDYELGAQGIDIDSLARPDLAREVLVDAARTVKVRLSTEDEDVVVLPADVFGRNEVWYTREQLNRAFAPQLDRAEMYVSAALRAAQLAEPGAGTAYDLARTPIDALVDRVDVVVLSGGMAQVPYVEERLRAFFTPETTIEFAAAPAENAVAIGLAHAAGFGRINRYRPAFDIVVEWDRGREQRTVYEAFTPLVQPRQIVDGDGDLRLVRTGADLSLPTKVKGKLRLVSYSDERVAATLGNRGLDGFSVLLDEQKFEFSIFPDGRLRLVDGGGTYDGHLDGWTAGV